MEAEAGQKNENAGLQWDRELSVCRYYKGDQVVSSERDASEIDGRHGGKNGLGAQH